MSIIRDDRTQQVNEIRQQVNEHFPDYTCFVFWVEQKSYFIIKLRQGQQVFEVYSYPTAKWSTIATKIKSKINGVTPYWERNR